MQLLAEASEPAVAGARLFHAPCDAPSATSDRPTSPAVLAYAPPIPPGSLITPRVAFRACLVEHALLVILGCAAFENARGWFLLMLVFVAAGFWIGVAGILATRAVARLYRSDLYYIAFGLPFLLALALLLFGQPL